MMRTRNLLYKTPEKYKLDAYSSKVGSLTVKFSSNNIDTIKYTTDERSGLRVLVDGRLGYAGGTNHVPEKKLINDAIKVANFGADVGKIKLVSKEEKINDNSLYFNATNKLNADDLIRICQEFIDIILAKKEKITVNAVASRKIIKSHLVNLNGLDRSIKKTVFSASVSVKRNLEGDLLECSDGFSVHKFGDARATPDFLCDTVLNQLDRCSKESKIKTGSYPVVFINSAIASFLYPLLLGLNGINLSKGISPLCENRGEIMIDKKLHLYSDPLLLDGLYHRKLDDEGNLTKRVDIIKDRKIHRAFFDVVSAAIWKKRYPTQNKWPIPCFAYREGFGQTTYPDYDSLVISPGNCENILDGISQGLLIEKLIGVKMGNPISGEFSNNIYIGHKIEKGRIVGRVKNVMVSGNIYQSLNKIEAIGTEPTWINNSMFMPPIRISDLQITSKI